MKHIAFSIFTCLVLSGSILSVYGEESMKSKGKSEPMKSIEELLEYKSRQEIDVAMANMRANSLDVKNLIKDVFRDALRDNKADFGFYSRMARIISLIEMYHVDEIEVIDGLFMIIDYQVDMKTIPMGINLPGQYLYPAANALVQLRIPPMRILSFMREEENPRRLQLAGWILSEILTQRIAKIIITNLEYYNHDRINSAMEKVFNEGLPKVIIQ